MKNFFKNLLPWKAKRLGTIISTLPNFTTLLGFTGRNNIDYYKTSIDVSSGIRLIANAINSTNLTLHQMKSNGNAEEISDHEVLELLEDPNPFQVKAEFWKIYTINKFLAAEAFWYKVRDSRGKVVELWNLRPDYMTVILDRETVIRGYQMQAPEMSVTISPEDIIHFRDPDPQYPFRGVSPLASATSRIETEQAAVQLQNKFIKNNKRPDFLLLSERAIPKNEKETLKKSWEEKQKGGAEMAILSGGLKYQQISTAQDDVGYIKILEEVRDDVARALGIPQALVASSKEPNRATYEAALVQFYGTTVKPEMEYITQVLNRRLLPEFDARLYMDFDDPTPEDRELKLKERGLGVDKWISRNQIRAEDGEEPVEGGDDLYVGISNVPLGEGVHQRRMTAPTPQKTKNNTHQKQKRWAKEHQKIADEVYKKVKEKKFIPLVKDRAKYEKVVNKEIDNRIRVFQGKITNLSEKQREEIENTLIENETVNPGLPKEMKDRHEEELFDIMFKFVFNAYERAGSRALDMVREKSFEPSPDARSRISEAVKKSAAFITSTTFEKLENELEIGLAEQEGASGIATRIGKVMEEFKGFRSERIARTELTRVSSEGTLEGFRQSNVVQGKEWITAGDERVRDEHLDNDGTIVETDGVFPNGETYPGENSINCRCVLGPARLRS